jgi:sepiapterin reductase
MGAVEKLKVGGIKLAVEFNVASMMGLTSLIMSRLPFKTIRIVNVSTLLATVPMESLTLYSTTKSARDMFMRCLAKEYPVPKCRALSYAPGPLKTDMFDEISTAEGVHEATAAAFKNMTQHLLLPGTSAAKLAVLLEKDEWESGAHLDFFDLP